MTEREAFEAWPGSAASTIPQIEREAFTAGWQARAEQPSEPVAEGKQNADD